MEAPTLSRYPLRWLFLLAGAAVVAGLIATAGVAGPDGLRLTVLYDNIPYDKHLQTDWGFSCLVEKGPTRLLFDTGARPEILASNLKSLALDVSDLDAIVFSHAHADHTAGLRGLPVDLTAGPPVYVLRSFPTELKERVRAVEVDDRVFLEDRDFGTTGEIPGRPIAEQALFVKTERGLVVLTGCAHPGVVNLVRRAKELGGEKIYLVAGGFHLLQTPAPEVEQIAKELRSLGVERVAPSHCTGEAAIEVFKREYGAGFVESGVGKTLLIDSR
jgi:7,8-dihydropterin-6-yl-methyl-4-(beta-D-ribofuranosyl)aminobenzene 5'-phosphate synthase